MQLVFAPYLKLRIAAAVGPWTLVPTSELPDVASGTQLDVARRLAWAYNEDNHQRGAFAFKTRAGLGRPIRKAHLAALHRALTLAVLDANDAGSRTKRGYTTEHAAIWVTRLMIRRSQS